MQVKSKSRLDRDNQYRHSPPKQWCELLKMRVDHPQCSNLSKRQTAFRFFCHCENRSVNDRKYSVNVTSVSQWHCWHADVILPHLSEAAAWFYFEKIYINEQTCWGQDMYECSDKTIWKLSTASTVGQGKTAVPSGLPCGVLLLLLASPAVHGGTPE